MKAKAARAIAAAMAIAVLTGVARGEVYRVGPGREYEKISTVADMLAPGDVVEVAGDITDYFTLQRSGTAAEPIVIRGVTRVEGERIVRPEVTISRASSCSGDHYIFEGLSFTTAEALLAPTGGRVPAPTALMVGGDNIVVRDCRFHHNRQALYAAGAVTVEFCEFEANGYGGNAHSLRLLGGKASASATVQFCTFRDATGGNFIKSYFPRITIRYNWFENAYHGAIVVADTWRRDDREGWYPGHCDIVGNVLWQGWTPGPQSFLLSLGGEGQESAGTEGDIVLAHNLLVVTRHTPAGASEPQGAFVRVPGNVDRYSAHNNVFLALGVSGAAVYHRGLTWESDRTKAFVNRRGSGEPVIAGVANWVSRTSAGVPEEFSGTILGDNPRLADLAGLDLRPRGDSPLAGAGAADLAPGRTMELAPEFEPQRFIPADLRARRRAKRERPSIGPFEVD